MLKAELKKRMAAIEGKVYEAQTDAEMLLDELESDQGRISDSDVGSIAEFIDSIDSARSVALEV